MKKQQSGFSVVEVVIVVLVAAVLGLIGWYMWSHKKDGGSGSVTGYLPYNTSVAFKTLKTGGAPSNGQIVKPALIKSQADLESAWSMLYGENTAPALPNVDFAKQSIVLVAQNASSGGHSLKLDKITKGDKQLSVHYTTSKPGKGCYSTMSLRLEYVLAAIPATTKTANFVSSAKTYDCN
jgi:hypothetical protein